MKSRGVYETPGGTILIHAHRAIESITLDRGESHLKDEIMPKYAEAIYNGLWFSSERLAMQELIDSTQKKVNGKVKLKIFKGNVIVLGRKSENSLYENSLVSFDEKGEYNQKDAEGFIKINSIRLKKQKKVKMGYGDDLLITAFAAKQKLYPNRQIVIGNTKKIANHSEVFDNNPNIADCRNLDKNKDIHIIDYHPGNRPYIDYVKNKKTKYVWSTKFKPTPGEMYFSTQEDKEADAKRIIEDSKILEKYGSKMIIKVYFLETSSTRLMIINLVLNT